MTTALHFIQTHPKDFAQRISLTQNGQWHNNCRILEQLFNSLGGWILLQTPKSNTDLKENSTSSNNNNDSI